MEVGFEVTISSPRWAKPFDAPGTRPSLPAAREPGIDQVQRREPECVAATPLRLFLQTEVRPEPDHHYSFTVFV